MKIIQSDQDLSDDIDISYTQISKINENKKAAVKDKVKSDGMEIIRGDETASERLVSLMVKIYTSY